jgi:hypothetical protein
MSATRFNEAIQPMTLGNMRANGVQSLAVQCHKCHHEVVINGDGWGADMIVALFGPRMICTKPSVPMMVRHRSPESLALRA